MPFPGGTESYSGERQSWPARDEPKGNEQVEHREIGSDGLYFGSGASSPRPIMPGKLQVGLHSERLSISA